MDILPFDPTAGSDDAFLLALSDAVRAEARPDRVLALTARALGERLKVDRVGFGEVDDAGDELEIFEDWHSDRGSSLKGRHRLEPGSTIVGAYRAGRTVIFSGAEPEAFDADRAAMAAAGIVAFIGTPLLREGRWVRLMAVNHGEPRAWTAEETDLVRRLAERTWQALDHLKTAARLRDSEAQFRTLAESLPSICWVSGPDGVAHWYNSRGHEYFRDLGVDLGDMAATCHPDELSRVAEVWSAARATGEPIEMKLRLLGTGRVYRPCLSQARPVRDETGKVVRWCGVITDLSEQHAAEARRLFLLSLAERVRDESDPQVFLDVTLEMLGQHLGASRVTYAENDAEDPMSCETKAQWLDGTTGLNTIHFNWADVGLEVYEAYRRGETLAADDTGSDPRINPEAMPTFDQVQVRAGVGVPLVKDGRFVALLDVHQTRPRDWSTDEIELVQEVAERTWAGLQRTRAEAALAAQEADQRFLLALSDATRNDTDPRTILGTTLAALGAHLGVARTNYAEADATGEALRVEQDWVDGVASVAGASFPLSALGEAVVADHLTGRPFRTDDVSTDPRFDPAHAATYRTVQVGAFISIPLVRAGKLTGVLSAQSAVPRPWSEREVRLMQEVAERNWANLQRARSEERLRESEEQFRTLAEHLPNICYVTDAAGEMLWKNRAFDAFFGTETRLSSKEDIPNVVRDEDVELANARWTEALASGEPLDLRLPLVGADGRLTPFLTQTRPVRDAQGRIARWCGVMTDLSDQEAREARQAWLFDLAERLREERDPVEILAVSSGEAGRRLGADRAHFAVLDADNTVTIEGGWAAPGAEPHAGRHDFGLFGEQALLAHRSGQTLVIPDIASVIRDPAARATFARYGIGSGVTVPLLKNGLLVGFFTVQNIGPREWKPEDVDVVRDVAERGWTAWNRAKAETALARSRADLAQSEKLTALGSLLAGVSHELNNPLSIIVAQSVMMERQTEDTALAVRAEKIRKAADRCARIVQTFLAMARQKAPEREAITLNEIVGAALDMSEYGLRAAGVSVVRDLTDAPTALSADGDQLHQVVMNLITNALQAMEDLSGPKVLTLSTRREGEAVVLEVSDTGPGVPADLRARIFEPFFTTKPQGEGTGVGLSFSHGIVAAHGGSLELDASEQGGALFRVRLEAADPARRTAGPRAEAAPATPRRALVVDDELDIAESVADLLGLAGFACEVAHGGEAARRRLSGAGSDYDLVLSDIRMPDLDGPGLFDWIRIHRLDLASRIAFATGDTLGAQAARFLEETDRPFVEKPITPESLAGLLDRMGLAAVETV